MSDSQNLASCILTPISPSLSRIYTAKFTLLAIRDFLNTFSSRDREWWIGVRLCRLTQEMFVDQLQFCPAVLHPKASVSTQVPRWVGWWVQEDNFEMRTKTPPLPDWGDGWKFPCVRVSGGGGGCVRGWLVALRGEKSPGWRWSWWTPACSHLFRTTWIQLPWSHSPIYRSSSKTPVEQTSVESTLRSCESYTQCQRSAEGEKRDQTMKNVR